MGRLQRHQQKQFISSVIFFTVLLILIIYFIYTYGFKFLLDTSLSIGKFTSKNSEQSVTPEKKDFIGKLEIDSIPAATNSARIVVSGSVLNFDSLEFYLNKNKVKTVSSIGDIFNEEIGDLRVGDNELYILAKSKKNSKEQKSNNYTITYKKEKPKLEIKEPADNSKTNKQEISITGSTDKDNNIKVNEYPVVVDVQGNFQTTVKLNDGENKIDVIAQDIAGNIEKKTLTVTYQKDD